MKTAIQIVQQHIISELSRTINDNIFSETFWSDFTTSIILFETYPKQIYQLVLDSKLPSEIIEELISAIPSTFSILISELAQEYVKGHTSEATTMLLNSKETIFKEEVKFFVTLNKAVNIMERQKMKSVLPDMFEKLQKKYLDNEI
jgi:hypothetical protein